MVLLVTAALPMLSGSKNQAKNRLHVQGPRLPNNLVSQYSLIALYITAAIDKDRLLYNSLLSVRVKIIRKISS